MFVKNSRKIHFITLICKGQFDPSGYKKEDQRKLDRTEVGNSQHKENLNVYSSYCHKICFPEHDLVKFRYSEKATEFEKIFHIKFDVTE